MNVDFCQSHHANDEAKTENVIKLNYDERGYQDDIELMGLQLIKNQTDSPNEGFHFFPLGVCLSLHVLCEKNFVIIEFL